MRNGSGVRTLRHVFICGLSAVAVTAPALAQESDARWQPYVQLLAKPGTDRSLGRLSFFVPVWQDDRSLAFGDLRLGSDNDGQQELNIGAGYRVLRDEWILGAHAYYDLVRTDLENTLGALTVGAEAISADWDITANGYIGLGGPEDVALAGARLIGGNIYVETNQERALHGVDLTVGRRFDFSADADLRLHGGGFAFFANGVESVTGGRAGVQYTRRDVVGRADLILGAEAQYDNYRGFQGFGEVAIRIPLGQAPERRATALEARMVDPVVRDIDVVVRGTKTPKREAAYDPLTGQAVSNVATAAQSLDSVVAAAAEGAVIVVASDQTLAGPLTLKAGQRLAGGGATVTVMTREGTLLNVAGLDATAGSLTFSDATQPGLVMADGNELNGLSVTGGRNNIHVGAASNVVIRNATLTGAAQESILVAPGATPGSIELRDVTMDGTGTTGGLVANGFNGRVTLNNVTMSDFSTLGAVWLADGDVDLTVTGSTFARNYESIVIENSATKALTARIEDSTFSDGTGSASAFVFWDVKGTDGAADDIVVRNNRFTNLPGVSGYVVAKGDTGIVITDNVFTNPTDSSENSAAISLSADNGAKVTADLSRNQITGASLGMGIYADGLAELTATISGGSIRDLSRASTTSRTAGVNIRAQNGSKVSATVSDLQVDGVSNSLWAYGLAASAETGGHADIRASDLTISGIHSYGQGALSTAVTAAGIYLRQDSGSVITESVSGVTITGVTADQGLTQDIHRVGY